MKYIPDFIWWGGILVCLLLLPATKGASFFALCLWVFFVGIYMEAFVWDPRKLKRFELERLNHAEYNRAFGVENELKVGKGEENN